MVDLNLTVIRIGTKLHHYGFMFEILRETNSLEHYMRIRFANILLWDNAVDVALGDDIELYAEVGYKMKAVIFTGTVVSLDNWYAGEVDVIYSPIKDEVKKQTFRNLTLFDIVKKIYPDCQLTGKNPKISQFVFKNSIHQDLKHLFFTHSKYYFFGQLGTLYITDTQLSPNAKNYKIDQFQPDQVSLGQFSFGKFDFFELGDRFKYRGVNYLIERIAMSASLRFVAVVHTVKEHPHG